MKSKNTLQIKMLILSAIFAALVAIGGFIKIPMPGVPFTLQFLFTNLAALLLGKKYGAFSCFIYMALGLVGLPIFTQGGGIGYVLKPSFGYILGFIVGTYVCGLIIEKAKVKSFKTYIIASVVNMLIVYTIGMIYFAMIMGIYIGEPKSLGYVLIYCGLVFIPGDLLSGILSSALCKRLSSAIKKFTV